MTARRGTGLAELLVTLVLSGLVMATAARALLQHVRLERDRASQRQADEVVRDVHAIVRAELGHADRYPRVLGDTAIELASLRAVAVACDVATTRLIIPSSVAWWSPPRAGDSVAVIDTLTGREWHAAVASTGTQHASVRCPAGGTRLTLATAAPTMAMLLPLRVWRVVRYVAYRAGDGTWWLGERSCLPACGSAQPIAGPIIAPVQGGWRLAMVAGRDGRSLALDISVRAAFNGRTSGMAARIPLAPAP
jgi:hypothetical protein